MMVRGDNGTVMGGLVTYSSPLVHDFLGGTQFVYLPYSPDLASDFWLSLMLKLPMKGRRFKTVNEIQENATKQLRASLKGEYAYCFEK